jgi:Methyltransferase domain
VKAIDLSGYPNHHFNPMIGNGCALSFPDQSYDIGFSNSVIEHVGSWENQQAFASEIRRVGKALWVQTPAKECPIEPHYIAPFVHWLPKGVQRRILRYFSPWGWIAKPTQEQIDEMVNTTRLITYSEMKGLFPDCEILVEKYLWIIPKSYIAVRKSC